MALPTKLSGLLQRKLRRHRQIVAGFASYQPGSEQTASYFFKPRQKLLLLLHSEDFRSRSTKFKEQFFDNIEGHIPRSLLLHPELPLYKLSDVGKTGVNKFLLLCAQSLHECSRCSNLIPKLQEVGIFQKLVITLAECRAQFSEGEPRSFSISLRSCSPVEFANKFGLNSYGKAHCFGCIYAIQQKAGLSF